MPPNPPTPADRLAAVKACFGHHDTTTCCQSIYVDMDRREVVHVCTPCATRWRG